MTRTPLTGALALALVLTAGCGGDPSAREGSEQRGQRHRPAQATAPSATPATKPRPDDGPARERRSIAPAPPQRSSGNALTIAEIPDAHLIGAGALGARWSVGSTGDEGDQPASVCQRATLHDIGAMETRVRDFAADRFTATQAVSRFGDPKSAWRAEQVIIAWRDDCTDQLRERDAALGTVRHGSWLSVVEVAGLAAPGKRLRTALAAVEATF